MGYTPPMAHARSLVGRFVPSRLLGVEFPLVERELARAGKTRLFFIVRGLIAGYAFLGITLFWASRSYLHVAPQEFMAFLQKLLSTTAKVQFVLPFAVLALAPPLIAREKEEGSLDMLFVAGFRGLDIYAAKLIGVVAPVVMLVLLPMPLFTLCGAWGLCNPGHELLRQVLVIAFTFALAGIGLLASSYCRRVGAASLLTLFVVLAWTLGCAYVSRSFFRAGFLTYLNGVTALAAGTGMSSAASLAFGFAWGAAGAIAFHVLLTVVLGYLAVRRLPRMVYAERRARKKHRWRKRRPYRPLRFLPAPAAYAFATMSGTGPAVRNLGGMWLFMIVSAVAAWLAPWLLLSLLLLLCYDTVASARDAAREGGVLSDVLLMPVDDRQAARHFLRAYTWAGIIYVPSFVAGLAGVFATSTALSDPLLWVLGLVACLAATRCAVLCGANLAFQGGHPVMATIASAAAVIEVGALGGVVGFQALRLRRFLSFASPERVGIVGALVACCLTMLWYYPRYAKNFRAAVFEPKQVKKKNW
ncbi:MAG: ABC transporter permease [bacterium]|nr:ABC transporter permease [bacterium]